MDQIVSPARDSAKVFLFRLFAIYLILIFLFLSNYLETYHFLAFLNKPFHYVTLNLTRITGRLFLKKKFTAHVDFRDYYWTYIALLIYLFIAVIIALFWTVADKAKKTSKLFTYTSVFARYYLGAILLGYGISKLFGDQFSRPDLSSLFQPFGNLDPHTLFWEFMGASKSYQIFGGVLETGAGILLLFKRTTTIGCFICLALFLNILMLDIAYDTLVKIRVVYFILLSIFILIPDLKKLYQIFILRQSASLSLTPSIIENEKYRWVQYALKFCFIGLVVILILRKQQEVYSQYHYPQYGNISGIYKITDFYLNHKLHQPVPVDSIAWNKIAINQYFPISGIQLLNDSIAEYSFKIDTIKKIIDLSSLTNSKIKATLHYTNFKPGEWLFEGTFKNDSICFTSKKIMKKFTLEKGYGKTIWDFDF
jgi:uncharacterized membrane protein YphA (DoxX/SURF4 family)